MQPYFCQPLIGTQRMSNRDVPARALRRARSRSPCQDAALAAVDEEVFDARPLQQLGAAVKHNPCQSPLD